MNTFSGGLFKTVSRSVSFRKHLLIKENIMATVATKFVFSIFSPQMCIQIQLDLVLLFIIRKY